MVDVRSEKKEVTVERREHPRLEIHCDTTIPGLKGIHTLTDISFGGCFIEAKIPGKVKIGQIINLKTKLPTETKAITVKAQIVEDQAHSESSIGKAGANESQKIQIPVTEKQQIQSHAAELPQGQKLAPGQTTDMGREPALPDHDEKSTTAVLANSPDLDSNAPIAQGSVNLETKAGPNTPVQTLFTIEIDPIFSKNKLNAAKSVLQDSGLDPELISEMGSMKVVRLLEGSYARNRAQIRLKEIQEVVDSAFVIPEKGKLSIYYLLQKLEKKNLIYSRTKLTPGRGPARKIYHATAAGKEACREQTLEALQTTHRFQAPILMGLANLPHISLTEALAGLKQYYRDLDQRLSNIKVRRTAQRPLAFHVEALFDYSITTITAEKKWIKKMIQQLEVKNDQS